MHADTPFRRKPMHHTGKSTENTDNMQEHGKTDAGMHGTREKFHTTQFFHSQTTVTQVPKSRPSLTACKSQFRVYTIEKRHYKKSE
jgi:hypothetical protein